MPKLQFCYLYLSCKDRAEATQIAEALLNKRLIVCAKQLSISSDYRWQGKLEHNDEILLVMESRLDLFERIETEVAKLHNYDTFVLEAVPIAKVSKKATRWMEAELK